MNVFKIVGNSLLRLHVDNIWRPINYLDSDTLIRKINEYRYDQQYKITQQYIKNHENKLKTSKCYYP
jgi:hypothetical protein